MKVFRIIALLLIFVFCTSMALAAIPDEVKMKLLEVSQSESGFLITFAYKLELNGEWTVASLNMAPGSTKTKALIAIKKYIASRYYAIITPPPDISTEVGVEYSVNTLPDDTAP